MNVENIGLESLLFAVLLNSSLKLNIVWNRKIDETKSDLLYSEKGSFEQFLRNTFLRMGEMNLICIKR